MIKFCVLVLSFIILLSLLTQNVSAFSIDTTFGNQGLVNSSVRIGNQLAKPIAIQSDGKIIVGGYEASGNYPNLMIGRYNQNGSIDSSFATNGIFIKDLGLGSAAYSGLEVQQTGKIVFAGGTGDQNGGSFLSGRLNTNGSIDPSFGLNGYSNTKINEIFFHIPFDSLIQPDQKILVVGHIGNGNGQPEDITILRYDPEGILDQNFGNGGIVRMHIPNDLYDHAYTVALQSDGKILTAGISSNGSTDSLNVTRYNNDGSIDATFGTNGFVFETLSTVTIAKDIKIQSDGKILVVGIYGSSGVSGNAFVLRYNSNGTRDSSFANNGLYLNIFESGDSSVNSLVIQPNGGIILGGYIVGNNGKVFALNRLNSNGTIDTSFGDNGLITTDSGQQSEIDALLLQNDGSIIAAGGDTGTHWILAKYIDEVLADLNVPLIKQTSNPWKNQVYDSANLWNPKDPSINAWGCAVTSAAMVLNYNKIKKLPDGKILDPGSLNGWLKKQKDGYIGNGILNWLAISRLSKLSKNINNISNFDALEFTKTASNDKSLVKNDLVNNIPDILEEPGHFTVAKGVQNNDIKINDPVYPRISLSDYQNNFLSINKFTPSHTDLSYIMLTVNPNININLKDSHGNSLGQTFIQNPIINPSNPNQNNSNPLKILYLPKPPTDDFQISLSSSNNTGYSLGIYSYDKDGNIFERSEAGNLTSNQNKTVSFHFDGQVNLYPKKVTFDFMNSDIDKAFKNRQIKDVGVLANLKALTILAKTQKEIHKESLSLATLIKLEDVLNKNKGAKIIEPAYSTLLYDVNYLETHL